MVGPPRRVQADVTPLLRPSGRQRQILDLGAQGLVDKEIARRLGCSYRTVRSHLERLYVRTGAANRTELVAVWVWLRAVRQASRPMTGVNQ